MDFTDDDVPKRRRADVGGSAAFVPARDPETRKMTDSECWGALAGSGIGQLALRAKPVGVDIYPINYLVKHREFYFRSGPGTKLEELAEHPFVALQVQTLVEGWWLSVLVKGKAQRLAFDDEIEASGILELDSAQRGDKMNFVRIVPETIVGRTFPDGSQAGTS